MAWISAVVLLPVAILFYEHFAARYEHFASECI